MQTITQKPLPAEQPITITLTAQHWQVVWNALQELPYRIVFPVIQTLASEFQKATSELALSSSELKPNGDLTDSVKGV